MGFLFFWLGLFECDKLIFASQTAFQVCKWIARYAQNAYKYTTTQIHCVSLTLIVKLLLFDGDSNMPVFLLLLLFFLLNTNEWISLVFVFYFQILLMNEEITSAELDFFLRFPIKPHVTSPVDFLSNTSWGGVCTLSAKEEFRYVFLSMDPISNSIILHIKPTLPCIYEMHTSKMFWFSFSCLLDWYCYRNLDRDIETSSKRWKKFVESDCPEKEKFPQEWKNKTALQRMCMMRALR